MFDNTVLEPQHSLGYESFKVTRLHGTAGTGLEAYFNSLPIDGVITLVLDIHKQTHIHNMPANSSFISFSSEKIVCPSFKTLHFKTSPIQNRPIISNR